MPIINIIIATVTALLVPGMTSDLYIPEPLPITSAHVVQQINTEKESEVKLVPKRATTSSEVACNCYNILGEYFSSIPSMESIQSNATSTPGAVAVFKYPPTKDWPDGIPHVAITTGVTDGDIFEVEEYNYKQCTHSYRFVSLDDVRLVGFINLQPLSPPLPSNVSP